MYNGNGYGNGYGQGPQGYNIQEDYYARGNATKVGAGVDRDPFIEDGTHRLALMELFEYNGGEKGPIVKGRFLVLQSAVHPVGSVVCKLWFLTKPAKFQNGTTDADRFADFALKLKGVDPQKNPGYPIGNDIRTLLKVRAAEQPARGTVIDCKGVKNKKGTWIEIYWNHVEQSPEQVVQMRQQIDSNPLHQLSEQFKRSLQGGQPQQQYGQQQMPYQGAPHPSQMAGQYPAQTALQGYGQPPMQQQYAPQGYAQQPAQMPPQQQQYAPGPQPGYGQMQSPVPPQQPQQGYGQPQPGVAAQMPPQGGQSYGPQGGGNTGW